MLEVEWDSWACVVVAYKGVCKENVTNIGYNDKS